MHFSDLEKITHGQCIQLLHDDKLTELITDSRKAVIRAGSVFIAIAGERNDGHSYIPSLYQQGIKQFIVEKQLPVPLQEANILKVENSIKALQDIARAHRETFDIPIIGITGSNGKTIIKEWLFQMLSREYAIAKNPGSYNSQIGVPLSVWGLQDYHQLGIFEAGISRPDEMENISTVIQPTLGIFTNIGTAHDEGFTSLTEKIKEKLKLFSNVQTLICCHDHHLIVKEAKQKNLKTYTWGFNEGADILIYPKGYDYVFVTAKHEFPLTLPFTDKASLENCFHCIAVMLHFNYSPTVISERVRFLKRVPMRLELKAGINNCQVIDDTYNNDLGGLQISLDFLVHQKQREKKRVIISDIEQAGMEEKELAEKISFLIRQAGISTVEGVGPVLKRYSHLFPQNSRFYSDTEEFLKNLGPDQYQNEVILLKGARSFKFEKIVQRLQHKQHRTVMEINLSALIHNLNYFRSRIPPGTRIMAMVKAFAYGSGSIEVANVLQYNKVDYLGVAYTDEGVDLRRNNIRVPILVMNPTEADFDQLLSYQLEPEIYSLRILRQLLEFLHKQPCTIHLKLDTGMHRLGLDETNLDELIGLLTTHRYIRIASIFSHLAGADEAEHDEFSRSQGQKFILWANRVTDAIGYKPLYHILNSSGILRLPELHLDMVRLGIGLYGIDPSRQDVQLQPVATLKTFISQIKNIKKGDSIGYGRSGTAQNEMKVATIAIGYADGYSRAFSKGIGEVLINGKRAPVIGNVCMDMTMVDITKVNAKEGDEVIIFGEGLDIQEVASKIKTIPYEILTNTSDRVKRIFVAESI